MYKIKAPSEEYDRKIGGVQFVSGEAQTDNEWLASWFSGRAGFTVETTVTDGQAYRLRVTVSGEKMIGYVDSVKQFEYDASAAGGKVGLRGGAV